MVLNITITVTINVGNVLSKSTILIGNSIIILPKIIHNMILIMLYLASTYFLSSKNVMNEYTIDSIIAALYKLKARRGVHMRHRVNDNRKMMMSFFSYVFYFGY